MTLCDFNTHNTGIIVSWQYTIYFCSYVHAGGSDEACGGVSLATVLSFCTGSEYPPPLGFDSPITMHFDSNTDWPLASTCSFQLILPTKFANNFEKFKDNVVFGLLNHGGFGLL